MLIAPDRIRRLHDAAIGLGLHQAQLCLLLPPRLSFRKSQNYNCIQHRYAKHYWDCYCLDDLILLRLHVPMRIPSFSVLGVD